MFRKKPILHASETIRIAYERAKNQQALLASVHQSIIAVGRGAINLFQVFGIDPEREKLYTGDVSCFPDAKNGIYWAIRTVDKDAPRQRWDCRVGYVGDGARIIRLAYWFKQGDPETPKAMGAARIIVRSDGTPVLTMTEDVADGALFPPIAHPLSPVV